MHIILPTPKWNKTTDDLDSGDLALNSVRLAQDYERSLLPHGIIFPRPSQIWEALRDCDVNFNAFFTGPALKPIWLPGKPPVELTEPFPFGRARLLRGERVRIEQADDPKPVVVWFKPLRYQVLQEGIVPEGVRKMPRYSGYTLSLRLARASCCLQEEPTYFTEVFRLIEDLV